MEEGDKNCKKNEGQEICCDIVFLKMTGQYIHDLTTTGWPKRVENKDIINSGKFLMDPIPRKRTTGN